jgi:glucuronoarabinoxylan endo-1,4-beta-xylanase
MTVVPPTYRRLTMVTVFVILFAATCGGGHGTGRGGGGTGGIDDRGGSGGPPSGASGGAPGGNSGRASGGVPATGAMAGPAAGGAGFGGVGGPVGPVNATVTIDIASRFQTMEGFGGALAFYANFLSDHPNRNEIYDLIFRDLGLDILRIGNWYQTSLVDAPTVAVVAAATASLGHAPRLLMSSWSPPASLKSNADTKNGGTLIQQNGAFAYDAFGQWWLDALRAYAARGVRPDFISIQNEPDFVASWETCLFGPGEGIDALHAGISVAGYDRALEAVFARVQSLAPPPQLLGPEVSGIGANKVQGYLARLNLAHIAGIAHHLYSGGLPAPATPDSFSASMQSLATTAGGISRFMTEFASTPQDMFATAWLIHNAVTIEGASAYIYWDLTWASLPGPSSGLVTTENPYQTATWTTAKGYIIRDSYYALKHYSRWIDTGWTRVGATTSSAALKASAFVSPDGRKTTVVLLNTGTTTLNVALATGTWTFASSDIFRTAGNADRTREIGPLSSGGILELPPRSIATAALTQ